MFESQEGLCAICSDPMCICHGLGRGKGGRCRTRAHVDHDHVTGKVRGLLCRACNVGIGQLRDSPVLLQNAVGYVLGVG